MHTYMCREFHVIKDPGAVNYIYTPDCKSTSMHDQGVRGVGGGGKFVIHEMLIAELCSFIPPSKHTLITVSSQVSK